MHDPYVLPSGLPVPVDDGAADHLPGTRIPSLVLESSHGPVDVAGFSVLYVYPRSGKPGEARSEDEDVLHRSASQSVCGVKRPQPAIILAGCAVQDDLAGMQIHRSRRLGGNRRLLEIERIDVRQPFPIGG